MASSGQNVVVAGHDYSARNDRELSLKRGQQVVVLERQENGWWLGEIEGRRGLIPSTYVRELSSSTSTAAIAAPLASSTSWAAHPHGPPPGRPAPPPTLRPASASTYRPRPYSPDLKTVAIVKAVYDFTGDSDKKLTFKKGDQINVVQKLQEVGWWEGEINGKVGLFPSNYAEEVKRERAREAVGPPTPMMNAADTAGVEDNKQTGEGGTPLMALCLYDFASDEEKKLSLKKGEKVEVLSRASDSWWKGRLDSRVGYFPSAYVRILDSANNNNAHLPLSSSVGSIMMRGRPAVPPGSLRGSGELYGVLALRESLAGKRVVALYDYNGRNENELSFAKGDRLQVLEDLSVSWSKGEKDGKVGRFPKNYVRLDTEAEPCANNGDTEKKREASVERERQPSEREKTFEQERLQQFERLQERLDRERIERQERETRERMERSRQERERLERERLEREQERERLEKEKEQQLALEKKEEELATRERERQLREDEERRAVLQRSEETTAVGSSASPAVPTPPAERRVSQERRGVVLGHSHSFVPPSPANSSAHPAAASTSGVSEETARRRTNSRGRPLPTPPSTNSRSSLQMSRGPPVPTAIPTGTETPQLRRVGFPSGGSSGSFSSTSSSSTPFADPRGRGDSGEVAALRRDVASMRHRFEQADDESQMATTFEQLRRLVLDERNERRRMAERLTSIEERLSKLGA